MSGSNNRAIMARRTAGKLGAGGGGGQRNVLGGFKWSSQHVLCELIGGTGPEPSAGVLQPRVFRGLLLRAIATAAGSSALCALRSVPFGKYWRSSPLVFSFVPRCQGLWGSQK